MEKARKREITVEAILWHHSTTKENLHPVKLKITANRNTKYYPLQLERKNIFLSEGDWYSINNTACRKENKSVKEAITGSTIYAKEIVSQITRTGIPFSFERFELKYFAVEEGGSFLDEFKTYLDDLFKEGRIGNYRSYLCSYRAFVRFLEYKGVKKISAYELTVSFLKEYDSYLINVRGTSRTTVGIYTRSLRAIFNVCTYKDTNLKDLYPFGSNKRGKYKIFGSTKGAKRGDALTLDQLREFVGMKTEVDTPLWDAKLYWLFSFYCQGMNFRDIAFLKYSNIQGQTIRYTREKTKRTEDQEIIEIPLSPEIREIIISLSSPDKRPTSYVFPILNNEEKDILRIEAVIMQKIKVTNARLKKLCDAHGLPRVTTYWSRHSYASLLKMQGVSVDMIRELLGHSNVKTTEHYLKRFDFEAKRIINQNLTELVAQRA